MTKVMAGRRVRVFRCQVPPLIGPKVLNAHVPKDLGWEAEVNEEATGITIKDKNEKEFFIFGANVIYCELYPEEPKALKTEFGTVRRGPGRPKVEGKSDAV